MFTEAVDQLNCRLVDRLDEMADVIRELLNDAPQRERLGRAARSTFNKSFTRRALLPRFAEVVEAVAAWSPFTDTHDQESSSSSSSFSFSNPWKMVSGRFDPFIFDSRTRTRTRTIQEVLTGKYSC
jgi:hypothetical protein